MKAQIKSLYWKLFCTIGGWGILLTLILGISNYYFVTRYAVNKDIVQTELIKKQTDKLIAEMKNFPKIDELQIKLLEKSIDKLEREIIKLDSKSDEILKRITIAEKGNIIESMQRDTIKDIIPALKITQTPDLPQYIDSSRILFNISIENKGKYSVKLEPIKILLATTNIKLDSSDKIAKQLLINKDYTISPEFIKVSISDIAPGEVYSYRQIVTLLNLQNIPSIIYYKILLNAETDPTVIESIKNIKKGGIQNKKYYAFVGDIIKPNSK